MQTRLYFFVFLLLSFLCIEVTSGQTGNDTTHKPGTKSKSADYIKSLDTLLHLRTSVSAHQMEYTLVYNKDFKMVLAPNEINSLSFGLSYRYLDLGLSVTPAFLNPANKDELKGESERFSFRTGFSIHRFNLNLDLNSVKGFYLKNSKELRAALPDSPYSIYPDLAVKYFSLLLRYNVNPNFSTASLSGGTQVQLRSAFTVLPTFQFATFTFHDDSKNSGVQNESTYSTDLNLLFPVLGTLVISPKISATLGVGPSVGVDFFKSVAINDSGKVVLSKGTEFSLGYTLQTAIRFHQGRFFTGFESQYRSYGHEIEEVSRLIKQFFYFQFYLGWRLKAPVFAKKTLDRVNKISPVNFD